MVAALYGTGIRPGERYFCPSSPAWGHGLWHGTLAPLALGLTVGAYSGRFNAERLRFYTKLSTFGSFGKGWVRRVADNLSHAANDNADGVGYRD